jgi:uncharacterized protein YndB with AHSA1/START domain
VTNTIQPPIAKAHMLIRKPVAELFEALVDPAITSRFWFSKDSGRLEAGKQVRWDWEMYGVFAQVDVKAIEKNKRVLIEWDGPDNLDLGRSSPEARTEPSSPSRTGASAARRTLSWRRRLVRWEDSHCCSPASRRSLNMASS